MFVSPAKKAHLLFGWFYIFIFFHHVVSVCVAISICLGTYFFSFVDSFHSGYSRCVCVWVRSFNSPNATRLSCCCCYWLSLLFFLISFGIRSDMYEYKIYIYIYRNVLMLFQFRKYSIETLATVKNIVAFFVCVLFHSLCMFVFFSILLAHSLLHAVEHTALFLLLSV